MRQSNYEMCMIKLINLSSLLWKLEGKGELAYVERNNGEKCFGTQRCS